MPEAGLRLAARGTTALLGVFLLLTAPGCVTAAKAAHHGAAWLPSAVKIGGVDYVEAAAVGSRLGLTATAPAPGKLVLRSRWTSIELQTDSRECQINGLRVFLGDAVRSHRGAPHLSRIDAERLFTPVLLPGAGGVRLPHTKVIVIDPGHGGKDSGKVNQRHKIHEKEVALDTSRRLKKLLEQQGHRVVLTRNDDRFLSLEGRAEIAGKAGADLLISVHFNSVESGAERVTGIETFTMTPRFQYSTSDSLRQDSMTGNAHPGNDHDHWNTLLGYHTHREMVRGLKGADRGLKRARWAVLRLAPCPAILIEGGYLSNDAEARRIATPEYRQQIAAAIAEGVRHYVTAVEGARNVRNARDSSSPKK